MNKKLIFKILGIILGIEGVSLLIPFVIALVCRENTAVFGVTALLCLAVGLPLSRLHTAKSRLQNRDGYVAVALGWIVLSAFGALPYALSGCCGYVDALFETVSGFTTTGASIFGAPASLPRGIQLWRALTQWLGGMGVLVLLLALMPKLGEGSVNLMKAESPGPISSKLLPRTNDTAKMLYSIYILLTAAETLALRAARMPWFDAVTTALTTISTGGFSVRNESIAYYQSSAVNWIIVVFMFVSSVNFTLLFLAGTRRWREVLRSDELRVYSGIVFGSSALIALDLVLKTGRSVGSAIEHAAFQVTTLISTTGYCTEDFDLWPQFSRLVLLVVMFAGGCAGSTAGGIKVSRIVLLFKGLKRDLRRILHVTIRKVTEDVRDRFMFNTAVSSIMELVNAFYAFQDKDLNAGLAREVAENLIKLLAPFAPHITEELWSRLFAGQGSVHQQKWPTYDEAATKLAEIEIVLQINGKVRDKITIPADTDREGMQEIAMGLPRTQELTAGKTIVKVICVPKKLVNIVVKG